MRAFVVLVVLAGCSLDGRRLETWTLDGKHVSLPSTCTPAYMAPELARGVHGAGAASDIFSFGVIAFELATGQSPFRGPPLIVVLAGGTVSPPDTSSVDPSLRPIVERCLALEPAHRPTAPELVALLA